MFLLNGMRFPNEKVYYAFNRMDRMEMVTLMHEVKILNAEEFGVRAGGSAKANSMGLRCAFIAAGAIDGLVEIKFPYGVIDLELDPFETIKMVNKYSGCDTPLSNGLGAVPFETILNWIPIDHEF